MHGWGKVLYQSGRKPEFSLLESPEKQESSLIPRNIGLKACKELPPSRPGWQPGKNKASYKSMGEGCRNLETKCKARAYFVLACCLVRMKLKVSRARPLPAACSRSTVPLPRGREPASWFSSSSTILWRWVPEPWEPDSPGTSSFSFQVVESGHSLMLGEGAQQEQREWKRLSSWRQNW